MTPRAWGLLALLAVVLATAVASAAPARPRPCVFTTLADGTTMVVCPRPR